MFPNEEYDYDYHNLAEDADYLDEYEDEEIEVEDNVRDYTHYIREYESSYHKIAEELED